MSGVCVYSPMQYPYFVVLIWLTTVLLGSLALVILLGSKKISSRVFAFIIGLIIIWSIGVSFMPLTNDPALENILLKFTFYMGGVIAASCFYFTKVFPEDLLPNKKLVAGIILTQIFFIPLFFGTNILIGESFRIDTDWGWGYTYGPFWFIFDIMFIFFWVGGILILYKKYKKLPVGLNKTNIKFMMIGLFVGFLPPNIFSIILPRLGIFSLNWIGPLSGAAWLCVIAYSIIRYRQMNVRAVITEVLAIAMAAIFFINIFIDIPFGVAGRVAAFLGFLVVAYFLIRGVLQEAKQREELDRLNHNLAEKVAEQTVEIRRSLEAERHARIELEKLNDAKDQFIMITQHHLRTPLNGILWGLESSISGANGRATKAMQTVLEEMQKSGKRLMKIVDDFLNITAIKVGTNILNLSDRSLLPAIEDCLQELKNPLETKKITVTYPKNESDWPPLHIDFDKMRESLFIILENAVKYNREGGEIVITTRKSPDSFMLEIANTGIGITSEESEKIGSSLFYRGEDARTNNPIGMGIGLSVVKAIIKAHKGTFSIDSKGKNEGARVTITLLKKN